MAVTIHIPLEVWENIGPRTVARITQIFPKALLHHATAATHYGDGNADFLGIKGQFAELWRKIMPLKRAMWDGEKLTREQPPEIIKDLIGHCLLALQMYEDGLNPPDPQLKDMR